MKFLKILCILLCLTQTTSLWAVATVACSKEDIQKFKDEYVKLQNALKYEGMDIALKNNRVTPVAGAKDENGNDSPGKKAQEILLANYNNALIKVGKIYRKLQGNSATEDEKKILNSNPDVVNFFKAINSKSEDAPAAVKVNLDTLLNKLQQVKIPGFELTKEDIYLLKDLIAHSQDRICTLAKYTGQTNKSNSTRTQYLEQLKNEPLNKMIASLKEMKGTNDLQLANTATTLGEAVENSLNNLREIIKAHKGCEKALKTLNIGEKIQGCNYDRFIKSLSADDGQYDKFESVLHFINANQMAKDARTSLDWIGTQFKATNNASCFVNPENKNVYVKNLPFNKEGTAIDTSKVSCTSKGKKLNAAGCVAGLNVQFENGLGFKLTSNKNANVSNVSIAGSTSCSNVALNGSPIETPACTDKQELKDGKCVDKPAPVAESASSSCTEQKCKTDFKIKDKDNKDIPTVWENNACYSVIAGNKNKLCAADNSAASPAGETKESCTAKKQEFDEKNKTCIETKESCAEKKQEFDEKAKTCVAKKEETKESCEAKKQMLDDKTKTCIDKPALTGRDKCDADETKWQESERKKDKDGGDFIPVRYRWIDNKCVDQQAKRSDASDDDAPEDAVLPQQYPQKAVPGRFQPVSIPTRQVYILPGMP